VIAGYSIQDTLWYLMISETVVLSRPRLWRPISESVKDGSIAYVLNKPYNFLLYHASMGLGDGLLATVANLIMGGALVWLLVGPPPSTIGFVYAGVALFLAWWIEFCTSALIGLAAFATEEVAAFDWIYQKILFILGGLLVPLDFYPAWLQTIARYTPFAYTVYGPARIFVDPSLPAFVTLIGQQLIWLAVTGLILFVVYRLGVRRLTINGG
jgi:ABC-2 type transport system permease protein